MEYTIELWASLLEDFAAKFIQEPAIVMGNSVGSLASLTVREMGGYAQASVGSSAQPWAHDRRLADRASAALPRSLQRQRRTWSLALCC